MKICDKCKEYGFNDLTINELMKKTKHKKYKVEEVNFLNIDPHGNYCLNIILEKGGRDNVTLHVSPKKLKKVRRDTLITELLK